MHALDIKFRGALCYIDAYKEPVLEKGDPPKWTKETREEYIERLRNTPTHLCRLRHFDINRWSVAFYTYSNEKYSPCVFPNGDWFGTIEDAFDIGAVYENLKLEYPVLWTGMKSFPAEGRGKCAMYCT